MEPLQEDGCLFGRNGVVSVHAVPPHCPCGLPPRNDCKWTFGLVGARLEWQDGISVRGRTCGNWRRTSESQHLLWMPSNVGNLRHSYCETDCKRKMHASGRASSVVLQGFSGPPTYAARRRAFLWPKAHLLRNGAGDIAKQRKQERKGIRRGMLTSFGLRDVAKAILALWNNNKRR